MNSYAQEIIQGFRHISNREKIQTAINNYFQNHLVSSYLDDHLDDSMEHFVHIIQQELRQSDPMPGMKMRDVLNCFTTQFINGRLVFIKQHVVPQEQLPYVVTDGCATSRNNLQHYQQSTNDILNTWLNPSRSIALRSDTAADTTYNRYSSENCAQMSTGIAFSDQRALGTQNHVEQYHNTAYKNALNQTDRPHENFAFGVSNDITDKRLLDRRTFRSEGGVENAIPLRETRLYRRNMDRDISEGLHNEERSGLLYGYDMSTINARVDRRNEAKKAFVGDNQRYC